jgi:DNA helicase IV
MKQFVIKKKDDYDDVEYNEVKGEFYDSANVRKVLNMAWMPLTPEYLVRKVLNSKGRLYSAASKLLTKRDVQILEDLMAADYEFSDADLPLIDEAVSIIGVDNSEELAKKDALKQQFKEAVKYSKTVLNSVARDSRDFTNADQLAERNFYSEDVEEITSEFDMKYRHIVVDEAQELTPMQWRMLSRRSATNSFTIVGDLFQRSNSSGVDNWASLEGILDEKINYYELTVNYRNPKEIAEFAEQMVLKYAPKHLDCTNFASVKAPRSVPDSLRIENTSSIDCEQVVRIYEELAKTGTTAIIAPESELSTLPPNSITAKQSKGLEFDNVLLIEPLKILNAHENGVSDLYVALTRATNTMVVLGAEGSF